MFDEFLVRYSSLLGLPQTAGLRRLVTMFPSIPEVLIRHWRHVGAERSASIGGAILRYFRLVGAGESFQAHEEMSEFDDEGVLAKSSFASFLTFAGSATELGVVVNGDDPMYGMVVELDWEGGGYLVHSSSIDDYFNSMYESAVARSDCEIYESGRIYSRAEYEVFARRGSFCAPAMYRDAKWSEIGEPNQG